MTNPFEEIATWMERIESLLTSDQSSKVIVKPIEKPITTAELCSFLGITEPTVIRLRKRGKIPFLQIGGSIRYDKASVVQALEKNASSKKSQLNT